MVGLEEHLEMLSQNKRYTNIKKLDYSSFDKLHHLARSKSLEIKCDQCDYTARNKARLAKHIEVKHVFICDICKEGNGEMEYRGEAEFSRLQQLVHVDIDKTLTDEEFNNLNEKNKKKLKMVRKHQNVKIY